jgi:hypothetical protein
MLRMKGGRTMSVVRGKLFLAALAMAAWPAIQPVSAQTSSVGADGATRLLWRGTDNSASVWKLDADLNVVLMSEAYVKDPGWLPIAITTASTNNTYLLWRDTAGIVLIWRLDTNLAHVGDVTINDNQPVDTWTAVGLSSDQNPASNYPLRLIWRRTTGEVGVWKISEGRNVQPNPVEVGYGPAFGWDPGPP